MSNLTNDDNVIFEIRLVTNRIYAYVGLIMVIIGTIGNVCNIMVFTRLGRLSNLTSSTFLVASFIGSQCVLSTGVISRAIFGLFDIDPLVSSSIWCKIRWVIGPIGGGTALTCISLASIERYFVTSHQVHRHRWITVQRARVMILIIIIIWFIAIIPNAIYYTPPSCTITNSIYAVYSPIFSLIVYSTIPLLVLGIFCMLTWFNLKTVRRRTNRANRIQNQVNKMMIAQICIVLLTSVPNVILQIYVLSTRSKIKSSLRQAQESLLMAILTMIGFITHAGSFYVYLIASRNYRKNVKTVIFRCQNQVSQILSQATTQKS